MWDVPKEIRNKTIDEIKKIVSEWYDTSIKDERVALMITNGGYIHKPTLLKKLEEMREVGKWITTQLVWYY